MSSGRSARLLYVTHGGFRAIDNVFAGQGKAVLAELEDEVWNDAA